MKFRNDINGLRAIAVIAVVIFHFNPHWIPGGFAGVDVFFVISGFLMTSIIFNGLEHNNFKLIEFYAARANRIVPALAVLCFTLILFAYFFVNILDQLDLHRHINGSMWFFSNMVYWKESGYFDTASHEKWLLHTWSLSVEWQFYIIYPLALLILKSFFNLKYLKHLVLIGAILSFITSVIITIKIPTIAYYSLPTRAWEMMLGGLVFLYNFRFTEKTSKIIERLGVVLIVGTYFSVSNHTPWPGYLALIPTIGACLIIAANRDSSIITSNTPFKYIGKWSYSIYLWHWPIVVFGFYFSIENWYVVGIPMSLAMGFISYNLVEKKRSLIIRNFSDVIRFRPFIYMACVLLTTYSMSLMNGFDKLPPEYKLTKQQFRDKYEGHLGLYGKGREPLYINTDKNDFDIILIGDSYARHYYSFLKDSGFKVASLAIDGCYSTHNNYNIDSALCKDRFKDEIELIKNHKNKNIIISRNWNSLSSSRFFDRAGNKIQASPEILINDLREVIDAAGKSGSDVYIIGNSQGATKPPFKIIAKEFLLGNEVKESYENKKETIMGNMLINNPLEMKYKFMDISKPLCNERNCLTIKDGQAIYTDAGHLSKFGSNLVGEGIFGEMKR